MTEKWKVALKEFLKKYENDDDVVGAILCGSYALETQNDKSDIDVYLVLREGVEYYERGNCESVSYLIEYFKNTKSGIKDFMEKEFNKNKLSTINMFAYGKIIYDMDGSVKELQDLAVDYIDRPLNNITSDKLDINNYHLWDLLDELKVAKDEDRDDFYKLYFRILDDIYDIYAEFLGIPKLPKSKVYKILTNEDYRKKYHVFKIPEEEFVDMYLRCHSVGSMELMYNNIANLINYYYKKQGGFNVREFSLKTYVN